MKKKHIDAVQYMLNGGVSSSSNRYTDAFVEHILLMARDKVIEERLMRNKTIPEELYQTVCVSFEDASFHECNCSMEELNGNLCKVKKSIKAIPTTYDEKTIKVMSLNGNIIDRYGIDVNSYRSNYSLIKTPANTAWYYQNGFIYVLNNPFVAKLLVKLIPSEEIEILEDCMEDSQICAYGKNKSVFIPTKWAERIYKIAVDMILNKRQDKLNDSTDALVPIESNRS